MLKVVLMLFLCVLLNWLHFFFISFFYHFLIKSSLNVLCILYNFWLASIQIGCHAWSTLFINQVCWKENPSTCWCFTLYPELQLLRSEIPSGICAKLRTVAASNKSSHAMITLRARYCYAQSLTSLVSPEITRHDHSIIACSRHICMVLFFTHIPFVVNHTLNATPPE